jgi:LacI family transcriptional regulator
VHILNVCAHISLPPASHNPKPVRNKNIRIKDIARSAGVSVGTVDRVLHNRGKVSEESLKKVMDVLNNNEYKPNLIARMLGANRSYRIVVLIPNPNQDPYWSITRLGVIQAEAEWQNYGVQVVSCPFDMLQKSSFQKAAEKVLALNPDGVLIAPIFYHETLPFFQACLSRGIPFVLFNTNIRESKALSFIGQDLYQSGRVAAELICLGREGAGKFGVLHVDEDLNDSIHLLEKEKGFKDYVHEAFNGQAEVESLNRTSSTDFSFKKKFAKLISEPDLKGLFVSSSQGTATAASFLNSHGKNGIRLVGYDLLDRNVEYLRGGIIDFLIHQKPQQQAFLGVRCLANHLVFKKESLPISQFPLEVITRQNLDSYLAELQEKRNVVVLE